MNELIKVLAVNSICQTNQITEIKPGEIKNISLICIEISLFHSKLLSESDIIKGFKIYVADCNTFILSKVFQLLEFLLSYIVPEISLK